MNANSFIAQFKSDAPSDLNKVYNDYKTISGKLSSDRGSFGLNVLCVICRNLDTVPSWKDIIDPKSLLVLSIDCVRETRILSEQDRVKTLACIYHIQRYVLKQNKPVPPELVLKISYMPFELDSEYLLRDYYKTYWNILVNRITYIEKLKPKANILKLLPKLTEDILKLVDIYETIQFSNIVLIFLVKKLHMLYNEYSKELSDVYIKIFTQISSKDLKLFKKLSEEEILEVYIKLNECLYVIAENASKINFRGANLDTIVKCCLNVVGHRPDLFHCLQTFYLNGFCCILTDSCFTESVLTAMYLACETSEKLGYGKAMMATYPYINQFLRLFIEYTTANVTEKNFDVPIQEKCLKMIEILMQRLENCDQVIKCENCLVRTGFHDSLRLSFQIKNIIMTSLGQNRNLTSILPLYYGIVVKQYEILARLRQLKCRNIEKYFRKQQTDVHNTAIVLNKAKFHEYSIKLFDVFLSNELVTKSSDKKSVARAFYNKSICELDCKLYESALLNAYLSMLFAEDLTSEKYMSLVMDIKAKELKSREDEGENGFQCMSVLDACQKVIEDKLYGDLTWYISKQKFSELLVHEFKMYAKMWPSIAPVGGVWRSLLDLHRGRNDPWIMDESPDAILQSLYEVILLTPSVVRTIHSECFAIIVKKLLEEYNVDSDDFKELSTEDKLVFAALLCLQYEFELKEASDKYQWKSTTNIADIDQLLSRRSVVVEHAAKSGASVTKLLTDLMPLYIDSSKCPPVLEIYQLSISHLLHLSRTAEGLQLAYICCHIADITGDHGTYIKNAGILLRHLTKSKDLDEIIQKAEKKFMEIDKSGEQFCIFMCEAALYYERIGEIGLSARIVQRVQAILLKLFQKKPDINLDLALGVLMEAQVSICGISISTINNVLRHHLTMTKTGNNYTSRQLNLPSLPQMGAKWRKLMRKSSLAAYVRQCGALHGIQAYCCTVDTDRYTEALAKIDTCLKPILGLEPNDIQTNTQTDLKQTHFVPKDVETMVDNMAFRTPRSPTPCVLIPAFKLPSFFTHQNCDCFACDIPIILVLACRVASMEASVYFRAKELSIARNYFDGVLQMLDIAGKKLKLSGNFEGFIRESVEKSLVDEFCNTQVEILVEIAYFEIYCKNFEIADECIVKIHEIMQNSCIDKCLISDVTNLMVCRESLKCIKRPALGLELEFDSLKLSPQQQAPQTPVSKPAMPNFEKIVVKDDEIPKTRKVIKLNLDDDEEDFERGIRKEKKEKKFKHPNPRTAKPVLEEATPKTKDIPKIIVTQMPVDTDVTKTGQNSSKVELNSAKTSQRSSRSLKYGQTLPNSYQTLPNSTQTLPNSDQTLPNSNQKSTRQTSSRSQQNTSKIPFTPTIGLNKTSEVFQTPLQTPEQFFTPMSSIKTYTKLRSTIVKNLENEFSKETNSALKKKLTRATSPGKLTETEKKEVKQKEKEVKQKEREDVTRPRRLRQPIKLSIDHD